MSETAPELLDFLFQPALFFLSEVSRWELPNDNQQYQQRWLKIAEFHNIVVVSWIKQMF